LRVRGLPLLRRVQMMKRQHVQLEHSSPTKPAAWFPLRLEGDVFWAGRSCGEQPCRKKIELKVKALNRPRNARLRRHAIRRKRRFPDLKPIDGAAHWQSLENAAAGSVECGTRAAHCERTEELADAKEQLLRNAGSPLRTARICNRNPRCFHISRGDSVHATLRKPSLNFCSRCEALATPKPPQSRERPPILPRETSSFSYYPLRLARQGHRRSR
jgi:hypothetical protein